MLEFSSVVGTVTEAASCIVAVPVRTVVCDPVDRSASDLSDMVNVSPSGLVTVVSVMCVLSVSLDTVGAVEMKFSVGDDESTATVVSTVVLNVAEFAFDVTALT